MVGRQRCVDGPLLLCGAPCAPCNVKTRVFAHRVTFRSAVSFIYHLAEPAYPADRSAVAMFRFSTSSGGTGIGTCSN
jgi:hypothetical protein